MRVLEIVLAVKELALQLDRRPIMLAVFTLELHIAAVQGTGLGLVHSHAAAVAASLWNLGQVSRVVPLGPNNQNGLYPESKVWPRFLRTGLERRCGERARGWTQNANILLGGRGQLCQRR